MQALSRQVLLLVSLSCVVPVILSGCASTTSAGSVEANRSQLLLTDNQKLNAEAAQAYKKELADAKQKGLLNTDAKMLVRIRTIVDRMAPHTGVFRADAPAWAWETNLIKSDQVNAYCYPGGKIIVLTGIIQKLSLTDDELAAILGHEIAHALREHTREQQSQGIVTGIAADIASTKIGGWANVIGQGVMMSNSRTAETEADRIGVELMARAGYNPQGAVTLWKKMKAQSGGGGSNSAIATFLSTHPADDDRIRTVTKDAQTVYPLYEAAIANQKKETKPQPTQSTRRPQRSNRK